MCEIKDLNQDNYFSNDMNMKYMSASQFKDFMECEVMGLAKAKGEYVIEKTKALLVGGYVDAYFSHELAKYQQENPQIFKKDGSLLKDFVQAEEIIKVIEEDEMMMSYLNGEHQVIMTGEISGVPFKIKVDALHDDKIVDQKVMADLKPIWVEENGINVKTDFIHGYGYDIQGAIYQEIVRQNTGKKLPFILAIATKEENPDKVLVEIEQEYLDKALHLVEENAPRFGLIKLGLTEPLGCDNCPCCRKTKKVTRVLSYKEHFRKD